jgi:hypothetical protein
VRKVVQCPIWESRAFLLQPGDVIATKRPGGLSEPRERVLEGVL